MNTSLFVGIYQELLRAWPNRWLGFFIALVATSIVAVVVTALPDQYQSKAKVYINSEIILKPLLQGLAVEDDSENRVRILRVLQSTLVNEQNVDRLVRTPGMGFDGSTSLGRSRAMDIIKSGVRIEEEEQNLFALTFNDTNPVRARNVAHGLLSLFIETHVVQARAELQTARDFLDRQIAEYELKLRELEAQIADFQLRNVEALGETTFQARLRVARQAMRDAQLARQLAVETRSRVNTQIANASGAPTGKPTPPIIATDQTFPALIERMGALQTQLNQLLLVYTEKHPDVVATQREISLLSEQYGLSDSIASAARPFTVLPGQVPPGQAVSSAVGQPAAGLPAAPTATGVAVAQPALAPAVPIAQPQTREQKPIAGSLQMQKLQAEFAVMDADRKVAAAQAALKIVEQYSDTAPAAETGLEQLNRDYTLLKDNYEQLLRRRESARITNAADLTSGTEQFRIVQAPTIPGAPSGPDRRSFLMLGALLSVGAGGALAYALGLLRGTFVSAAEAEAALGLPVIARLTNRHGVFARVSQSADALVLLAGVAAIFIGAFVVSATTDLLSPIRTEIYRFIESDIGQLIGRLF